MWNYCGTVGQCGKNVQRTLCREPNFPGVDAKAPKAKKYIEKIASVS